MYPQPHPLSHFLVRMKPTSTNVFLQIAKNVEVTRGKIWAVRRMLKCFLAKSLKLIPHQIGSMGTGVNMQKDDSVRQRYRAFWLYRVSQYPQPQRNRPHFSAFLCLPPPPMLDEHTLNYAHLQSNKETTLWTCAFSLCMSPTLQMAVSICNKSVARYCDKCVLWRVFDFHWTAPYILGLANLDQRERERERIAVTWSVESLLSNQAARVRFRTASGISIFILGLGVCFLSVFGSELFLALAQLQLSTDWFRETRHSTLV